MEAHQLGDTVPPKSYALAFPYKLFLPVHVSGTPTNCMKYVEFLEPTFFHFKRPEILGVKDIFLQLRVGRADCAKSNAERKNYLCNTFIF